MFENESHLLAVVILLFELFHCRECARAGAADSNPEVTGGRARLLSRGF